MRRILLCVLAAAWIGLFFALPTVTVAGDFYPIYYGAQTLLRGHNPYGEAFVQQLQQLWPTHHAQAGFAYPLPLAFVVAPLALLPLPLAVALWLLIGAGSAFAAVRLRPDWPHAPVLLLLWMPLFDALWARQVSLLWFGMIAVMLLALRSRRSWLVGLCIVLLPIKPQIGILFAVYGVVRSWQHDRRALWWALGIGVLVWGGSVLVLPQWPQLWWMGLGRYQNVNPAAVLLPWSLVLIAVTWHLPWHARLAAAQVALFPLVAVYTVVPLALAWLAIGGRRALVGAAISWAYLPLRSTASASLVWLVMVVPLIACAYLDWRDTRRCRRSLAKDGMLEAS